MTTEARIADLPLLTRGAQEFYAEGKLPGRLVPSIWIRSWANLLASGAGLVIILWASAGVPAGAIGGIMAPDLGDGELCAQEAFWFVRPEQRGGGLRLLKHFERVLVERGVKRIAMAHLHELQPEALGALYERMGYRKMETFYLKEI